MRSRTLTSTESWQVANNSKSTPISIPKRVQVPTKIILPLVNEYTPLKNNIQWFRYYGIRCQHLFHMDNCKIYDCSPLDLNCKLQANVEYSYAFKYSKSGTPSQIRIAKPQQSSIKGKFQYQVHSLSKNVNIKPNKYHALHIPIRILFELSYPTIRNAKICITEKICIIANNSYQLTNDDINSIFVLDTQRLEIVIPTLPQRLIKQMLFQDKDPHTYRTDPIRISFLNLQAFNTSLFLINKLKMDKAMKQNKPNQFFKFKKNELALSFICEQPFNQGCTKYRKSLFPKHSNLSTDILNITSPSYSQNPEQMSLKIPNQQIKFTNGTTLYNLKASELIEHKTYKECNFTSSENNFQKNNVEAEENSRNFIDDFDELFQDQTEERQLCLNSSFDELEKKVQAHKNSKIIKQIQTRKQQQHSRQTQCKKLIDKMKELQQDNTKLSICNAKLKNQIQLMKDMNHGPKTSINQLQSIVNSMKRYEMKLQKYQYNTKQLKQEPNSVGFKISTTNQFVFEN